MPQPRAAGNCREMKSIVPLLALAISGSILLPAAPARADKAALEAAKAKKEAARRQRETGSFAQFNPTASRRDPVNTYFLSYLAQMVYPQNLSLQTGVDHDQLQTNHALFESTFKGRIAHFFTGPVKFQFFDPTTPELYNPEAVGIATEDVVLVVFRGTDRLENREPGLLGDLIFSWGEWIVTDANVQPLRKPREGLPGKLHRGMKESLDAATADITKFVLDHGGATKPVWLTGHSLGGGHAQIMAGYLKKRGADVRGVYVFNSPHPGDPAFAAGLDATLGQAAIQRFEFRDDPIAMLPPQSSVTQLLSGFPLPAGSPVGGFGRAGVRNYYTKTEGATLFSAQAERQEGAVNRSDAGRAGAFAPLAICFHNPHWITLAAFDDLPATTQDRVPPPPSLDGVEGCVPPLLETGRTGRTIEQQLVDDIGAAVSGALATVEFNAASIAANLAGTAIEDGDYFIRSGSGKYLDISGSCMNDNGCKAQLWDLGDSRSNNVFKIRKEGPSYRVTLKHNGKALEVEGSERLEDGGRVQIYDKNPIGGFNANQKWLFYRVPDGSRQRYILVNAASFKVLDAVNKSVDKNGGGVFIRAAKSNDATQVWVLEKAD